MASKIFISGANGRTGRAIIAALLAHGAKVRGLIRKPEHAESLTSIGVETAIGNLEDPKSLVAGAEGCDAVLHIGPPMYPLEVETTQSMLGAAKAAGAGQFIYYSVMQPLRQDVEHHRLKLVAEAHVVESGLPYTIVQPTRYMQHLEPIWAEVQKDGVHAMPFNTQVKFNVADLRDLAEATAIVATKPGHLNATYELAGPESLSQTDMAVILSEVLGRSVAARQISPEELRATAEAKGFAEGRIQRMLIMNHHYDLHGFLGNANIMRWVLGREPTLYRNYVQRLLAA